MTLTKRELLELLRDVKDSERVYVDVARTPYPLAARLEVVEWDTGEREANAVALVLAQ